MSSQIHATALTTYDVDPNGQFVRIHVRDGAGEPASLVLPSDCANQLMMSLPTMVETALRNSHGDDSLRLVHSLEGFNIELSAERNADGEAQLILTLQTGGGFRVSFVGSGDVLEGLARSIFGDALPVAEENAGRVRPS